MSKPEDIPQDVWDAVEDMDLNIAVASATSTASRAERMRKSIIARAILAAKAEAEAERDLLQEVLDSRPAINAALPDSYIRWSQAIYSGDFARAAIRKRGET